MRFANFNERRVDQAMDTEEPLNEPPENFKFGSTAGYTLCRQILAEKLPYEPHDVQIEGICQLLDGVDLFAILGTGSGKTGFISMYMLVVLASDIGVESGPRWKYLRVRGIRRVIQRGVTIVSSIR